MPIWMGVGASGSVGPTSGGKVTPLNNLSASPIVAVAANPQRASITFHNPGTLTVYVYPSITAVGQVNSPNLSSLGGTFQLLPGATMTLTGEIQGAWQAFSASGSNQPLTVMESNLG